MLPCHYVLCSFIRLSPNLVLNKTTLLPCILWCFDARRGSSFTSWVGTLLTYTVSSKSNQVSACWLTDPVITFQPISDPEFNARGGHSPCLPSLSNFTTILFQTVKNANLSSDFNTLCFITILNGNLDQMWSQLNLRFHKYTIVVDSKQDELWLTNFWANTEKNVMPPCPLCFLSGKVVYFRFLLIIDVSRTLC